MKILNVLYLAQKFGFVKKYEEAEVEVKNHDHII